MTNENADTGNGLRMPATLWEACLSAAGIVADIGEREAPGEAQVPAREMVAVVVAAAMHEQLLRRGLDEDFEAVRVVWLSGQEGLTAAIERSGYSAVDHAPAIEGAGALERRQLLDDGRASHPDVRQRWDLVRAAAVSAVETAARDTPRADAAGPVELADVVVMEQRRRQLERLQDFYGTED
jgi:hypothetical protein